MRSLKRFASDLPAPAKRIAQAGLSAVDPVLVARHRRRNGVRRPIPPVALRARVGVPEIGPYLSGGNGYVELIEKVLARRGRSPAEAGSALDFGCGCGRVLVPMAERAGPTPELHGCDIDEGAIRWLRRHHCDLRTEVNRFSPPLPYADSTFDLVYSVSVFTHLDEQAQDAWLREIRRVLAPDGVGVLTVSGHRALQQFVTGERVGSMRHAPERVAALSLEETGFVYEEVEPSGWNALRYIEGSGGWGLAFHDEDYIRRRWGEIFGSVEILSGQGTQDAVLVSR